MNFKCFLIIMLSIFLFSCGNSRSNDDEQKKGSKTPEISTKTNGLAPAYISGKTFDMKIVVFPTEGLGPNFPTIGEKIIQEYRQDGMSYIQSEQYDGLEYYGKYHYQRNGDEADISLKLTSSNIDYKLNYQFTDENSGTWLGSFNNGLTEYNGTFTTKAASNLNGTNFNQSIFIEEQDIYSNITNITYQYNVYLPESYSSNSKTYPVIYVTDAQWASDQRFARIIESKKMDVIVVGITQGPVGQRTTDFLYPGSIQYLEFFAQEFLPLIESQFRIDTGNRTLYGHSYGGVLIRQALINEVNTPLFKNFISSDGSFMVKNRTYRRLEKKTYKKNSLANRKLYLAGAMQANGRSVSTFYDTIRSYELEGFTVYHQSFDLSHGKVNLAGIRGAMDLIFP